MSSEFDAVVSSLAFGLNPSFVIPDSFHLQSAAT
jgi:hypothetical protein